MAVQPITRESVELSRGLLAPAATGSDDPLRPGSDDPLRPAGPGERWSALYTLSRREKQVSRACAYLGVRHYLPLHDHWTGAARVRCYSVPLFPSYVFACLDASARAELLATGALARVIAVSAERLLLDELKQIRAALAARVNLDLGPALRRGERVCVVRGPLEGVEGLVADLRRRRRRERLVLNVSMLGRAVATEIDLDDVRRMIPGPELARADHSLADGAAA